MSALIPDSLVRHRGETNGAAGAAWLERLPVLIAACADAWSLRLAPPFPDLTYNFAAPAIGADGGAVVLKICFPDAEFASEVAALTTFAGRGAVRLIAVDHDRGALLLERLQPGNPLADIDDNTAMQAAAHVMRQLWRPVPDGHRFPSVEGWVASMAERAPALLARHPNFPAAWIDQAVALTANLASGGRPVLLHGDLHQGNILSSRDQWRAIDPKGVVGDPAAEVGPLLFNQLPDDADPARLSRLLQRRLDVLSEALDLERERLRAWSLVRAMLSAFWSLEDHVHGWEPAIRCAEVLETLG